MTYVNRKKLNLKNFQRNKKRGAFSSVQHLCWTRWTSSSRDCVIIEIEIQMTSKHNHNHKCCDVCECDEWTASRLAFPCIAGVYVRRSHTAERASEADGVGFMSLYIWPVFTPFSHRFTLCIKNIEDWRPTKLDHCLMPHRVCVCVFVCVVFGCCSMLILHRE